MKKYRKNPTCEVCDKNLRNHYALRCNEHVVRNKCSEETKSKISKSLKGRKRPEFSEEWKEKISKNNAKFWLGKHLSEETKQKMSELRKGVPSPLKGRKYPNRINKRVIKNCLFCNKEIEVYPYELNKNKFCSKKCFYEYKKLLPKKINTVTVQCERCTKKFEVPFNRKDKAKFCSIECYWEVGKEAKKCLFCENIFEVLPHKENRKFCSHKCFYDYNNKEHHWNWKEGKSFEEYGAEFDEPLKELVRSRDNYECQECGKSQLKNGRQLDCHHIDYDKKNNDSINLIALCISCHIRTNTKRPYWTKYYKEIMNLRENL